MMASGKRISPSAWLNCEDENLVELRATTNLEEVEEELESPE